MASEKKTYTTAELMGGDKPDTGPRKYTTAEIMASGEQQVSPDEKMGAIAGTLRSGLGSALNKVGQASETIDRYNPFGAPLRSAISEAQKIGPRDVMGTYTRSFGLPGPSGKDLAIQAGISDAPVFKLPVVLNPFTGEKASVTPAGVVGAGIGIATDPLTYMPSGLLLKSAKEAGVASTFAKTAAGLKGFAEERAAKAGLGSSIKAFREAAKMPVGGTPNIERAIGNVRDLGRTLIDDKTLGLAKKTEDIGRIAAHNREKYGQMIGEIGKAVDTTFPGGSISAQKVAEEMVQYATTIPETTGGQALQNRILAEAEAIQKMGDLTFEKAMAVKNQFKFKHGDADMLVSNQDVSNKMYRIMRNNMDESVAAAEKVASKEAKELLGKYGEANKKYGQYRLIAKSAADRAAKDISNRLVSPSDYGIGMAGAGAAALHGSGGIMTLLTGIAASQVNKLARDRGPAFFANAAEVMGKMFASQSEGSVLKSFVPKLQRAAAISNTALVAEHNVLMNNDEKYRKAVFDALDDMQASEQTPPEPQGFQLPRR